MANKMSKPSPLPEKSFVPPISTDHIWLTNGEGQVFCQHCGADKDDAPKECPRIGM